MNYLNEHRYKSEGLQRVSTSGLEKGMIVSCRYTNKKGRSKSLFILILNPGYEGKVHAITLEKFSPKDLNGLAGKVGVRLIPKFSVRGLNFPKLEMIQSSRRFYGSFLRNIRDKYDDCYRTYFTNKLTTTFVVDYKFDEDIEKFLQ
tara:strand:- start:907 stop:1344 length:438 start_codon:yes stop_codon:yes gene_type:complete